MACILESTGNKKVVALIQLFTKKMGRYIWYL
jgi:hypothetical protein